MNDVYSFDTDEDEETETPQEERLEKPEEDIAFEKPIIEEEDEEFLEPEDSIKPNLRILEAILFAAVEPLTAQQIYERMPGNADVGGLLLELQTEYAGRGVNLVEMEGNWAFRTASDLGDVLAMEKDVSRKLSRAAMETLAIVAYHQPITRAEIENIRGVATNKGTLDILIEAGWVKPAGRRETPGRPLTWVTTSNFLDQFSLESIMSLPGMDDLKASGLLDRRPAIETLEISNDLFGEDAEDRDDTKTQEH